MKKILLVAISLSLALSGCMPAFLKQTVNSAPTVDFAATSAALGGQTQQAQATPTIASTLTPTLIPTSTATRTPPPPSQTPSPSPTLFSTVTTGTAVTPTNVTGTPSTPSPVGTKPTPTETLHPQFYGTQPPQVAFGKILMMNKSKAEAYISIKCLTTDNQVSIVEYPVGKWMVVRVPAGKCDYVAWVGGRPMSGSFRLDAGGQKTITLYKNRIKIK